LSDKSVSHFHWSWDDTNHTWKKEN
jgi:hypothetical protein